MRSVFSGLLPFLVPSTMGSPCLDPVVGLMLLCYTEAVVLPKLRFSGGLLPPPSLDRRREVVIEFRTCASTTRCYTCGTTTIRVLTQPGGCELRSATSTTFAGTFPAQRTTPRGMFFALLSVTVIRLARSWVMGNAN